MVEIDFRHDLLPLKNKIFRLALRITANRAEAEDITQDTLVKAWTKRAELAAADSPEDYCLTICRNLALDRREKKDNQSLGLESFSLETPDNALSAQEIMEYEERLTRIRRIFSQLPEKQRTVLQLRDVEERPGREVAEIMGETEENVKVLLFRARRAVRAAYLKIENYGL